MGDLKDPAIAEWKKYWTLPLAAALGYSAAVLHAYAIGPFIEPLQAQFDWSRSQISVGITIVGVIGAAFSVPVGMLIDRVGPRPVGLVGVLLMTSAFALLGTATGSKLNWYFLWGILAIANLGLQATVWSSAVASRFTASRGIALAVAFSGASLAAAIFPILASTLIEFYGWRGGFFGMGGIWALLVFPFMLLFFRGKQDTLSEKHSVAKASDALPGVEVADALRSSSFYKLMLAAGLFTFTALGIIVHFVPILTDMGANPLAAAGIASLVGVFSVLGRLGTGFLLDYFPAKFVGTVVFCLPIVASTLLLVEGESRLNQAGAAICFGLTVGAEMDVIAYLVAQHFGLRNYGVLFGVINAALAFGVSFGPLAAGMAFDWFGGYGQFLGLTIIFMALSGIALASLPRPPFSG